jgi:hypothetical protein
MSAGCAFPINIRLFARALAALHLMWAGARDRRAAALVAGLTGADA